MPRVYVRRSLEERFWPKVDRRGPDECWEWTASRDRKGYGKIGRGDGTSGWANAHRVSYQMAHGVELTSDQFVCHSCDNPPCVNPAHLWLGSIQDNLADMRAKGRDWASKQTHCSRGHEYKPGSYYSYPKHRHLRICRECRRVDYLTGRYGSVSV